MALTMTTYQSSQKQTDENIFLDNTMKGHLVWRQWKQSLDQDYRRTAECFGNYRLLSDLKWIIQSFFQHQLLSQRAGGELVPLLQRRLTAQSLFVGPKVDELVAGLLTTLPARWRFSGRSSCQTTGVRQRASGLIWRPCLRVIDGLSWRWGLDTKSLPTHANSTQTMC